MLLKTCCYPAEKQRKKNEDGKIVSAKIQSQVIIDLVNQLKSSIARNSLIFN
jgi:hypothetical protein